MKRYAVLGLAIAMFAGRAQASPITETFLFTASNFTNALGADPAPIINVSGAFTLTFDPTLSYTDMTGGISGGVNLTLGSALSFTYDPASNNGNLFIGGLASGATGIQPGTQDYGLGLSNVATGNPTGNLFSYAGGLVFPTDIWVSRQVSVIARVPEPLTLSLFGAGLVGAVVFRRRKAKSV